MYLLDPECSHRPTKRNQKLCIATKQTKKPQTSSYVHDRISQDHQKNPYFHQHNNKKTSEMQGTKHMFVATENQYGLQTWILGHDFVQNS